MMIPDRAVLWMALLLATLWIMGCDSDPDPTVDAGDGDADTDADDDWNDADVDTGPDPDTYPEEVAPLSEPEIFDVGHWMFGLLPSPEDPILPQIEAATMTCPEEGTDDHGITWFEGTPDENGVLVVMGRTIGYAIACVNVEQQTRLIARVDNAISIYTNGVEQPSDLYGSRRSRVPLVLDEGDNVISVRTYGRRGNTEIQLWSTPDELAFNMSDITFPDLVVGQDTEQWYGVPLLNLNHFSARGLKARVIESDFFEETEVIYPAVAPGAVTQIGFQLIPKQAWQTAEETVTVTLHAEVLGHHFAYEHDIELTTVAEGSAYRRTFRSPIDHSVQYYGVLPPSNFDPSEHYALVLSLHGAGVEAINQAGSYSQRDWNYVIAPTNRRPFGFDWEEWGRFNGLAALDDAMEQFQIDPYRVYVTGHSMGGHGTWHFGVTAPGRFATVGPSAGWSSFYSYTGDTRPTGAFGRARAHSDTNNYISNLANRGVYILHGDADDNVPVREGQDMFAAVGKITDDIEYHEQPGAGHWWNGDVSPGVDCVDWVPLFEFMEARSFDPFELDFEFTSSSPGYSPTHSFVTVWSVDDPMSDFAVASEQLDDTTVSVTTTNVATFELDLAPLNEAGITTVNVDGEAHSVTNDEYIVIGSEDGKSPQVHGPYNQVYRSPFCFLWGDDDRGTIHANYAAYLTSYWSIYGNGHACGMPLSRISDEQRAEYNLIYLGLSPSETGSEEIPFSWDESGVSLDGDEYPGSALLFVFPEGDHLSAVLATASDQERLLYMVVPFSSRAGLPDYLVWSWDGSMASGFFQSDWAFTP